MADFTRFEALLRCFQSGEATYLTTQQRLSFRESLRRLSVEPRSDTSSARREIQARSILVDKYKELGQWAFLTIASEWQVTALRSGGKYRAFREWASRQDPPAALRRLAEELCTSFGVGKVVEEADERLMNHHACTGKSRARKVRAAGQMSDKEADARLVSCADGNPGMQSAGHHSRTEHQQASGPDDVQDQRLLTTASSWRQMGRLGRRLQKACRMGRARSIMAARRRRRALSLTPRLASSLALFQISLCSRLE